MSTTVENLAAAANYLVRSSRCTRLVNEMNQFIKAWDEAPKLYAGDLQLLNPLIELGVSHKDKFDALLEKVYAARQVQADTRRTDYQKELMRRIRTRESSAVSLAEWLRGRRFTPPERAEFAAQQKAQWETDKRAFVERNAKDSTETRSAVQTFWHMVDMQLKEDLLHAQQTNPPPRPAKREMQAA